jgi:hypothetical protein
VFFVFQEPLSTSKFCRQFVKACLKKMDQLFPIEFSKNKKRYARSIFTDKVINPMIENK